MKVHLILDTTDNENLDQQRSRSLLYQKGNKVSRSYNSFYRTIDFEGIRTTSDHMLDWCTVQTLRGHKVS